MRDRLERVWMFLGKILPLWLRTGRRPVLLERGGALGDIICTFPAAEMLKKRHPKEAILYSCHRDFASLPKMGGITTHTTGAHVSKGSFWSRFFSAVYHFDYGDERPGEVSTQAII